MFGEYRKNSFRRLSIKSVREYKTNYVRTDFTVEDIVALSNFRVCKLGNFRR